MAAQTPALSGAPSHPTGFGGAQRLSQAPTKAQASASSIAWPLATPRLHATQEAGTPY